MLIAAAIGAALIAGAVIGFGVVTGLPMRQGGVNLTLPGSTISDFYGSDSSFITVGPNPNYFQAAQARRMKDKLLSDVGAASAVFCLGRNVSGSPAIRPDWIQVSPYPETDFRTNSTPSAFRNLLVAANTNSDFGSVFPAQQNGALLGTTNASIYLLGSYVPTDPQVPGDVSKLTNIVTYEIDFVPTVDPAGGTLASVRRYSGTNHSVPTDYYHAYYPGEDNGANGFRPVAAFFGRRLAGTNAFAVAVNQPFTFVWWPDPLLSRLGGAAVPAGSSDSARANYTNMAGRTSLFFVLPAFPSL